MTRLLKVRGSISGELHKRALYEIEMLKKRRRQHVGWKKLTNRKDWIRFKLSRSYRLVVRISNITMGPYECMNHSIYDKRFK